MAIGNHQLTVMLNLARAYPDPLTKNRLYEGVPPKARRTAFMDAMVDRDFMTTSDEFEDINDHHIRWRFTLMGWYHLYHVDRHLALWYRSARIRWKNDVKKKLRYITPPLIVPMLKAMICPPPIGSHGGLATLSDPKPMSADTRAL